MVKKLPFFLFLTVLFGLILIFPFLKTEADENFTVIIDAGHGGEDGGALSISGKCEKDFNLEMAFLIGKKLENMGYSVVYTRTEDKDTDGEEGFLKRKDILARLSYTEKYKNSVFITVHMNSSTSSADKGFQVFYGMKNEKSRLLAEEIYNMIEKYGSVSRLREVKKTPDSVYLTVNSEVPSILLECGFISNAVDEELLLSKEYKENFSKIVSCGIDKFCIENGYK